MGKKKKKKKGSSRVTPIIIGVIIVLCGLIPVSSSLFGRTGYITEITQNERVGGRLDEPGRPNAYKWSVAYKFRMENGKIETGSVQVNGDAVSSKTGLRAGSPVRYLAFYPGFNTPGEGGLDGSTVIWIALVIFGVFVIMLGAKKPKPAKTPAKRSREYKAAKEAREAKESAPRAQAKPVVGVMVAPEPDWDSFEYDDETPITEAEADELYRLATEEEVEDEFDLINSTDEGPAYCRKVLAIIRWRRANGL